jgi:hypothetical protein
MTGSADDGPDWQPHIRSKEKRRKLANRFKDAKDPFRIVIVRDMWLTGFDAPCLHTMYADKPMQGHGLMQAIARVNRVFRDKPGGLVVDYLGLADQLKKALITYTESGGQGDPTFDTAQAIAVMLEKHGIACDLMHGFNWDKWTTGKPTERLALIPAGQEHILEQDDGKKRWVQVVTELSRAFALCAASDEATEIRDDVSFFQALQAALNKQSSTNRKTPEQIDAAIRQFVSKAITTEGQVIDVFTAAGLTPSPPAQSGCAQCCALSVSVAPLAPSAAQAGHQHPERPVPRRSARPQAQERRRRVAGETAQGRTQSPLQAEPRAEPGLQREAQEDPQRLPQPCHLDDAGHRRTDQTRQRPRRRNQARGGHGTDR